MILIRVIWAILVVSSYGRASEITDAVLQSKDSNEIGRKLRETGFRIETAEQVPDLLFEAILKRHATDEEWKALDHYSRLVDAGEGLDFLRSCFNALKKDPLIFYCRFMSGDAKALDRMTDALTYDFSGYEASTKANYASHERFYEEVLNRIAAKKIQLSGDASKRHDQFMKSSSREFAKWKARYQEQISK